MYRLLLFQYPFIYIIKFIYQIVQVVSIDAVPIRLTASVFQSNEVKGDENSFV